MSIVHNIYHKQFLSLVKDVIAMSSNKDTSSLALKSAISDFSEKYWILTIDSGTNMYDTFCMEQKHKQKIMNTITILLEIVYMFADVLTLDDVWARIVDAYLHVSKSDIYYLDIFLNIIVKISEARIMNMPIAMHMMETIAMLEQHNEMIKNDMKIKFLKEKAIQSVKSCLMQ